MPAPCKFAPCVGVVVRWHVPARARRRAPRFLSGMRACHHNCLATGQRRPCSSAERSPSARRERGRLASMVEEGGHDIRPVRRVAETYLMDYVSVHLGAVRPWSRPRGNWGVRVSHTWCAPPQLGSWLVDGCFGSQCRPSYCHPAGIHMCANLFASPLLPGCSGGPSGQPSQRHTQGFSGHGARHGPVGGEGLPCHWAGTAPRDACLLRGSQAAHRLVWAGQRRSAFSFPLGYVTQ